MRLFVDLATSLPAWPVAAAVAMAAAGATLVRDLAERQQARQSGARRHVGPGLQSWTLLALGALVAPLLTLLVASRSNLPAGTGNSFLLALVAGAWLALAYGVLRCSGQRLAWQSGFLIQRRPFRAARAVPLASIAQVRLASRGYRLFLCDGTSVHVRLDDRGSRDLLDAVLADVAARPVWRNMQPAAARTGMA